MFTVPAYSMETGKDDDFTITKPYNPTKPLRQQIVDSLIVDPHGAFNNNQKINNQFFSELTKNDVRQKKAEEVYKIVRDLRIKFEQQSPVFLLSECSQDAAGPCVMSRANQPMHRSTFEDKIAQIILSKVNNKAALQVVHFGCGEMFSEMRTLIKILALNPQAAIDLHYVDKNYLPLCEAKRLFTKKRSPEIDLQDPIELKFILKNLVDTILNHTDFKNDSVLTQQDFFSELFIQEARFAQLLTFVQKTFPKARLKLIPHYAGWRYLGYCEQKKLPLAQVITAVDIDDPESNERKSMRDYLLLCAQILKKNPESYNLLLARIENDPFIRVSLQKIPGAVAQIVPIENDNKEKIDLYLTPDHN